ncbi:MULTISPECIES: DUF5983 family protein [Bacillus]|uniref:DUF5983 family protein n=1 Tax=Bacillus TaxID=1386 RepID=UPI0002FF9F0D|nr:MULTISPECIES: hypothetical protein [Bacillus]
MISSILTISSVHLTIESYKWLNNQIPLSDKGEKDVSVYKKAQDGWFIPVDDKVFSERIKSSTSIPLEFCDVYQYALKNNCSWILIDRNEDIIEDLPKYQD